MARYLMILLVTTALSGCGDSDPGFYQEEAITNLDAMTGTIGALSTTSFSLYTEVTEKKDEGLVTEVRQSDVYLEGPDHLYIYIERDTTRKGYWYDGARLALFDFDTNEYDTLSFSGTIIELIDAAHKKYDIDFPAADFLYPTLTDDLIAQFDTIVVVGTRTLDDTAYQEINAFNAALDAYMLIDPSTRLPKQLELYGLGENTGMRYVSTFSNWRTNPALPNRLFSFSPPENAVKASLF